MDYLAMLGFDSVATADAYGAEGEKVVSLFEAIREAVHLVRISKD